jgi:hypothetical protein
MLQEGGTMTEKVADPKVLQEGRGRSRVLGVGSTSGGDVERTTEPTIAGKPTGPTGNPGHFEDEDLHSGMTGMPKQQQSKKTP